MRGRKLMRTTSAPKAGWLGLPPAGERRTRMWLEVVQEVARENSGRLLAQRPDDLTTVASLGYEFNSYRNIIVFGDTPMHPGLFGDRRDDSGIDSRGRKSRFYFDATDGATIAELRGHWDSLIHEGFGKD